MAKGQKHETYRIECYDASCFQDIVEDEIGTYAEALAKAKNCDWIDKARGNFIIITKLTQVARVERPSTPIVTKF